MIKLFFVTFFIAELIIAGALILKIYRFDKRVNLFNKAVLKSQNKIKVAFFDARFLLEELNSVIFKFKKLIHDKREEYMLKVLQNFVIWVGFFSLKGKYKKTLLAYQLVKDIYDGLQEA